MPYGSVQEVNVHLPSGLVGDGLSASIKMSSREECEKLIEGLNVYGKNLCVPTVEPEVNDRCYGRH